MGLSPSGRYAYLTWGLSHGTTPSQEIVFELWGKVDAFAQIQSPQEERPQQAIALISCCGLDQACYRSHNRRDSDSRIQSEQISIPHD